MWESVLTVLGISIALSGAFVVNKFLPNLTLGKVTPREQWIPDYIDSYGNVVMRKVQ